MRLVVHSLDIRPSVVAQTSNEVGNEIFRLSTARYLLEMPLGNVTEVPGPSPSGSSSIPSTVRMRAE